MLDCFRWLDPSTVIDHFNCHQKKFWLCCIHRAAQLALPWQHLDIIADLEGATASGVKLSGLGCGPDAPGAFASGGSFMPCMRRLDVTCDARLSLVKQTALQSAGGGRITYTVRYITVNMCASISSACSAEDGCSAGDKTQKHSPPIGGLDSAACASISFATTTLPTGVMRHISWCTFLLQLLCCASRSACKLQAQSVYYSGTATPLAAQRPTLW